MIFFMNTEIARIVITSAPGRLGLRHSAESVEIHRYPAKSQISTFSEARKVLTTFCVTKITLHTYQNTLDPYFKQSSQL